MNKNGDEVLAEAMAAEGITIDKSQDDWITKTIDKINGILSKKYTLGQLKVKKGRAKRKSLTLRYKTMR